MPSTTGLRALGLASLVAIAAVTVVPASAAASTTPAGSGLGQAERVIVIAEAQLSKRYVYGAAGPSAFDCSGLVLYTFQRAGLAARIGGGHSGYGMYHWALARGLASRSNPQPGDIVVYGGGAHVGIYLGRGLEISALNPSQGIRVTRVGALLSSPLTAYIHTHLSSSPAAWAALLAAIGHVAQPHLPAYVTATGRVAVRAGESTSARVLGVVPSGTRLTVLAAGVRNGLHWYRVSYHGRSAWVLARYVRAA